MLLGQVGVGSSIVYNRSSKLLRSYIWSLLAPIHMTSLSTVQLGEVGIGSNISHNHSLI